MSDKKILVILTGGTICASTDAFGQRYSDAANVHIIDGFERGNSPFAGRVHFDVIMPTDILSENMTVKTWNILLDALLNQVDWNAYQGIIILHGTDTLAYTASLLSIVLAGVHIPVCLVSSQLPLNYENTNGHANFRASVELIMNNIAPNVYAVYRNSDGVIYTHYGSHLLQCANFSDDFFSADAMIVTDANNAKLQGKAYETGTFYLNKMKPLLPCVMRIMPYVGIDYAAFSLTGIRAIVHGTYHSDTVCVERKGGAGAYSSSSILYLLDRCKSVGVQLFLAPCRPDAYKYESTGDILRAGAYHISGVTNEMAYVKTLLGCALDLDEKQLSRFVNRSINHEMIY
ncbi:MAG: hypothetical protein E7456_04575 [Ruminococcaceae bacterium]|nr:hypothetical protein [Oscillospiraceae bacterium]